MVEGSVPLAEEFSVEEAEQVISEFWASFRAYLQAVEALVQESRG